MKKKTFLYITFIFCAFISNAQSKNNKKFNLLWVENQILIVDKKTSIKMPLIDSQFVNEYLIPNYTTQFIVDSNLEVLNYAIQNVQYEIFNIHNYPDFNQDKIEDNLKVEFKIVKDSKQSFAVLQVVPFIKKGNLLHRVSSLELVYELGLDDKRIQKSSTVKNSVMSTGNWYKFSVDTTGVFKIDRNFLQNLGINIANVNPKNIRIFGNGGGMLPFKNSDFRYDDLQENAIYVNGEEDNKFDTNDFVLFYAKGPHQWKNGANLDLQSISHQQNIFDDKAYYFISVDNGLGKRIQNEVSLTTTPILSINSFQDYTFVEKDKINLFGLGQQWLGDDFNIISNRSYIIPFKNIETNQDLIVRVRGVSVSSTTTNMNVKVNGQDLFTLNYPPVITGALAKAHDAEKATSIKLTGNSVKVDISFINNGNPSAKAYIDYIELIGSKQLLADGKQFGFRNFKSATINGVVEYQIQNTLNVKEVWNVTDFLNPTRILSQPSSGNFTFKSNGGVLKEFIVLNTNDYYSPKQISNSKQENQNLHALQDLDYIVITPDFLMSQAERLANHHRNYSNFQTKVINLAHIYNEFGSGSKDITAIRDFIKHLYDNASEPSKRIKYVALLGDASYDYKNRISGNNNIVPVFEAFESFNPATSYVTDDFYGMMDANEGEMNLIDKQDVATGRIPVSTVQEADQIITKILNYYSSNSMGDWRNIITFVADDIDAAGEEVLQFDLESIAQDIQLQKPTFNIKKIYTDAYKQEISSGGERYPEVNSDVTNAIEKGTLIFDYFGHGGEDGLASERILGVPEIQSWNNFNTLPLFITVTCEFARFDNPLRPTAGEYVFWNKKGGSINLISSTRSIFINVGSAINNNLIRKLLSFNNEDYSISETLMHSKNNFTTNQRFFVYSIGDPAMKLAFPKAKIILNKMNGKDFLQSLDTIKALSLTSFEGSIIDVSGNIINNFNGILDATIYDKSILRSTLQNNYKGVGYNNPMQFESLESKLFKGKANVINGKFKFEFIAPKDLRIAYGKGKISLYANNQQIDKSGYDLNVIVGGVNTNAPEDKTGPIIKLFLNDESFIDGGNTNQSPILIVKLEDASGINTSITAVDHDIIAILDGNQSNPIILNDFYETELNDYKKGSLSYQLRNLSIGLHTLTLKAWDTYNNSSEVTITFYVISDSELNIDNVLNYPNPFINYTEFWFNHNKPNEPLEVQIQIFTVSGKLVKTINQTIQTSGGLARSITWNGLDDFGDKIGKGVYIYKLKVKSLFSGKKGEKIEKLVILQ
ncbi:MAG: type IX secretion system sortase PorU [Flavobacteriaceae bacterium]|nr:type IX secretion system sortase PorU [Flavobacteriaceae bacterium]